MSEKTGEWFDRFFQAARIGAWTIILGYVAVLIVAGTFLAWVIRYEIRADAQLEKEMNSEARDKASNR